MAVYAKRLNVAQRRALSTYEGITGLEPIGQDDYDAGAFDFAELWRMNVEYMEHVLADVVNIDMQGTGA